MTEMKVKENLDESKREFDIIMISTQAKLSDLLVWEMSMTKYGSSKVIVKIPGIHNWQHIYLL